MDPKVYAQLENWQEMEYWQNKKETLETFMPKIEYLENVGLFSEWASDVCTNGNGKLRGILKQLEDSYFDPPPRDTPCAFRHLFFLYNELVTLNCIGYRTAEPPKPKMSFIQAGISSWNHRWLASQFIDFKDTAISVHNLIVQLYKEYLEVKPRLTYLTTAAKILEEQDENEPPKQSSMRQGILTGNSSTAKPIPSSMINSTPFGSFKSVRNLLDAVLDLCADKNLRDRVLIPHRTRAERELFLLYLEESADPNHIGKLYTRRPDPKPAPLPAPRPPTSAPKPAYTNVRMETATVSPIKDFLVIDILKGPIPSKKRTSSNKVPLKENTDQNVHQPQEQPQQQPQEQLQEDEEDEFLGTVFKMDDILPKPIPKKVMTAATTNRDRFKSGAKLKPFPDMAYARSLIRKKVVREMLGCIWEHMESIFTGQCDLKLCVRHKRLYEVYYLNDTMPKFILDEIYNIINDKDEDWEVALLDSSQPHLFYTNLSALWMLQFASLTRRMDMGGKYPKNRDKDLEETVESCNSMIHEKGNTQRF